MDHPWHTWMLRHEPSFFNIHFPLLFFPFFQGFLDIKRISDRDGIKGSRNRTCRLLGRDRKGVFRSSFRLTLGKMEQLAKIMIEKKKSSRKIKLAKAFLAIKAEIHTDASLQRAWFCLGSRPCDICKKKNRCGCARACVCVCVCM